VADIARALARRNKSGVYRVLALHGGIAPTPRRRGPRALRLEEREEISRGIAAGRSIRQIAQGLARSPSTVSREIRRNGGCSAYRASWADRYAWQRALRPKPCRLARHAELRWRVAQKLALQWSPKQISGWLERQFPADPGRRLSHETIYRSLFIQTRGVLKKELMAHLRTARQMRQAKGGTTKSGLGQLVDAVSIRERPAEVEDRAVPGHWEGDLLCGANNTHIATLVERHTRFVMLLKIPSKDTASLVAALAKHVRKLPQELRRSLTWDRGKEMADHKSFTIATKVQVYFCDPHSPWQRGSNENTNGLLRQYFPRGTDLSRFSQADLNKIALRLNQRPRQTLGFETPADRLRAVLQGPVELTTQSGHWLCIAAMVLMPVSAPIKVLD
jgi:IS30 family transposase